MPHTHDPPPNRDLAGYEVVVGVGAGIAAYKVCQVVSRLVQRGCGVTVAMSFAALKLWRAKGGGLTGMGWVGQACSPVTVLAGTGTSFTRRVDFECGPEILAILEAQMGQKGSATAPGPEQ